MSSSPRTQPHHADERTPLLYSSSARTAEHGAASESAIEEDDIVDAEVYGSVGLQPDRSSLIARKSSFSSHSHWLAPAEDDGATGEPQNVDEFKEDGLLGGISKTRFRFIFGGIVMGYFVSP
jgi:hypothetical protein